MPTSLLVSATYEREKNAAVLKFYEPKSQNREKKKEKRSQETVNNYVKQERHF